MKICRFIYKHSEYFGVAQNDRILFSDHQESSSKPSAIAENSVKPSDVKMLPPVNPSKIVCVGRNYAEHAFELGNTVPKEPLLFLKAPSSIITENESILIPAHSEKVEHEGELGVVIGKKCAKLAESDDPLKYILGFVCLNDVTARDLQKRDVQFTRAKSFDTFCPVGRYIETELDFADISVETFVNGHLKQTGRTSQMVFPIPFLIRYISNQMTLNPGDLIATGTPPGVSKLNPGDTVSVKIEGIGTLQNPVADADAVQL